MCGVCVCVGLYGGKGTLREAPDVLCVLYTDREFPARMWCKESCVGHTYLVRVYRDLTQRIISCCMVTITNNNL